jgi:ferredoxin-NADP reductase
MRWRHAAQAGRIDAAAIHDHALQADADYYLCGPVAFMQQQHRQLREAGVEATRIHMEVFGSNAMRRLKRLCLPLRIVSCRAAEYPARHFPSPLLPCN